MMLRIVAAAVRDEELPSSMVGGLIHFLPAPARHHDIVHAMHSGREEMIIARGEQGFLTSEGDFVGREEAARIALWNGQVKILRAPPNLYTEDLW